MPLNLPTYDTIIKRSRADVQALLASLDPTIFASLIRAIVDSNSGRHFDNVLLIQQLEKELFPTTATSRSSLEIWAIYEGIVPFPEKQSSGIAIFTGTLGSAVSEDDEFQSVDGNTYIADADGTIADNTVSIISLTRSGNTVTAITSSDHNFATNIIATIAGANELEYNGDQLITVLTAISFSYQITTTPASPATGTIIASCDCVSIIVVSKGFGTEQNLDSGAKLTSSAQISGVDNTGFVGLLGIIGGTDTESIGSLLFRVLQSRSNPVANFNVAAIEKVSLAIQGVTRIKVKRVTPRIGAVTILFMRDNDDNPIPEASEVLEVKTAILTLLQVTSEEDDVVVTAPTPVVTNYNFSSISPNSATMKTAITENLKAFYQDKVTFETDIIEDKYRSAITDTIDPDTGDTLLSFTLTSPTGTIPVTTNEIGTLGTITFP